ncbi:MAG TPA: type II secretion system F family protein [Actinomycetota bacterium]|nr:type II secretion system F family protein [Actinomycetota bacterium]
MAVGRRARRLRPVARRSLSARIDRSRAGRRIAARLAESGSDEPSSRFLVRTLGWTGAAAAAGWLWMGVAAAAVAAGAAIAVSAGAVRRRIRTRAVRVDEALPAMLDGLSAAMRAGASLGNAIDDLEPPAVLADAVGAMRNATRFGATRREALETFARHAGTERAGIVAAAITLGAESGGDLPRMLDVLAQASRDRARIAREARVASTQARMSVWVVAALPVVFLFLTGAASREQMHLLLRTPIGWGLLAAGGALEIAGLLWMRKLSP